MDPNSLGQQQTLRQDQQKAQQLLSLKSEPLAQVPLEENLNDKLCSEEMFEPYTFIELQKKKLQYVQIWVEFDIVEKCEKIKFEKLEFFVACKCGSYLSDKGFLLKNIGIINKYEDKYGVRFVKTCENCQEETSLLFLLENNLMLTDESKQSVHLLTIKFEDQFQISEIVCKSLWINVYCKPCKKNNNQKQSYKVIEVRYGDQEKEGFQLTKHLCSLCQQEFIFQVKGIKMIKQPI